MSAQCQLRQFDEGPIIWSGPLDAVPRLGEWIMLNGSPWTVCAVAHNLPDYRNSNQTFMSLPLGQVVDILVERKS